MIYPDVPHRLDEKQVYDSIQDLIARVSRLEIQVGLSPLQREASSPALPTASAAPLAPPSLPGEESSLELRIGEVGLAWVGSGILFLGIAFLMAYAQSRGYRAAATGFGYLAAVGLYGLAHLWRRSLSHFSQVMVSSSLLLLYYTTVRLGFFSAAPLIGNRHLVLFFLLLAVALQFGVAVRRNSQLLAGMALLLTATAALLIDQTHLSLPLVAVTSVAAVYLAIRLDWRHLLPVGIVLVYASHLAWLMGNPLAGHRLEAVAGHQYNLVYLFFSAAVFTWPAMARASSPADEVQVIFPSLLNSFSFSLLMALAVENHYQARYAAVSLGVALFFLLLAIIQWLRTHQQFTPAIYACFGYLALSIAIYGYAKIPTAFLWLAWQSLLVVSMALWFRSRTLVVMNAAIFANILLAYFASSPSSKPVNFSFAIVALTSARVMNWQKERLALRTELLRNVYLAVAFVLVFYALYQAVPGQYVTLSWTATAVVYFLLSYFLGSIKYRWMAISAILVTVLYLFLVDLAHLDPLFRVAAFLFLGLMALVVARFYSLVRSPARRQ